jgi:hypothetical protein
MLGWLKRVDAAEADAQVQRTAAEVQQRVAVERAVAAAHPPPRGPGRPPLKREALSVVAAEPDAADDAVMAADEPGSDTHDHTRRYTQWLTSPLFPLIHAAVCTTRSLRGAVTALHGQSMQVYGALAYGTLQKWYEIDSDGVPQLRERFRRFLSTDVPQRLTGGGGPRSFWDRHPEATNKIRELLMRARDGRNAGIIPSSQFTYEQRGAASVPCGQDDKRQITAVVGSSLNGDMLPLQLVFEGKTDRSLPQHTQDTQSNGFHLTLSDNHWSTLETMQQYVDRVLNPWRGNEDMILVLDAWSVHRSTFREWVSRTHKKIHLVFVPANCTSMLQVADVALNRPFKAAIKTQFEEWAASVVMQQIKDGKDPSLKEHLGIKQLRPRLLEWCYKSWMELRTPSGRLTVQRGWNRCVNQFYDVLSDDKRQEAVQSCVRGEFAAFDVVPDKEELPLQASSIWDDADDSGDELDESKPVRQGDRRGKRKRASRQPDIVSAMLAMAGSDDSELELDDC